MTEYPTVLVLVSPELLAQLTQGWSPPVQIRLTNIGGVYPGWEMDCRTPIIEETP